MATRTYTQEELVALGVPSSLLTEHMKTHPPPPPFEVVSDMNGMRKARIVHLETRRPDFPIPGAIPDLVEENDVYVDYPPQNCKIQVRVYAPVDLGEAARSSGLPMIVLMHEGGFMLGDISDEEHNARLFASSFDCIVLNVEYLLAPEHPFPIGVKSCYHVLEALASSPKTFHSLANPSQGLILGGSSAGGNLSAVLAHHARQQKLSIPVTGQWLGVPFIATAELIPEKFKQMFQSQSLRVDPVLDPGEDEATNHKLFEVCQVKDPSDPLITPFSPALYPPNSANNDPSLPKLAKAFIQAGGLDPLRDHAIVYARALEEDWNTDVRLLVYGGYGHMFWTNWPLLEESKRFWKDTVKGFEWLLGQQAKREW
ncbi:uncharacterized protein HMPREF1541_08156 [Cyphellophora europaea CBS 101466]|uniref:Alpha/beta hydrolase fold-3 domain-containing protein n=1 Tax=Cyphellophora europaea (strain CBS 101466) TaxID=1220924 RepID=W2RKZ1_CYPE1|nr:uncharacterized protein HMPREF1541_08156 [Cyphellophora europaea CBS 101466]ETN37166.1 hypothetical protein HMPREF1541_08156 [Cyphellophora europaea CBS 101466]